MITESERDGNSPFRDPSTHKTPFDLLLKQKIKYKEGKIKSKNSKNGFVFHVKSFFFNAKYFFDFWLNDIILFRVLTAMFLALFIVFRADFKDPLYFLSAIYVIDFVWHLAIFLKVKGAVLNSKFHTLESNIIYNNLKSLAWEKCFSGGKLRCKTGHLVRVPFGTELPFDILVLSSNFKVNSDFKDEKGPGKDMKKSYSVFQRLFEKIYNLKMDSISEFMSTDPYFSTDMPRTSTSRIFSFSLNIKGIC